MRRRKLADSCGCIFCDLDLRPVERDGRMVHVVLVARREEIAACTRKDKTDGPPRPEDA